MDIIFIFLSGLLFTWMLKVKQSSGIFHYIPKAFSVGRSPIKSVFLTPFLFWSSGIDITSSLLLEMNFFRWNPPLLHISTTFFTSIIAVSGLLTDFNKSSTWKLHLTTSPASCPYWSVMSGSSLQGIVWTISWWHSTKFVGTNCKIWWLFLYAVIFSPQELDECLLIFRNPHLVIHGFYVCHENNFMLSKPG